MGTLLHCWWECKFMQLLWKAMWSFLKKLKVEIPFDPVVPCLRIYQKETKSLIQKDTHPYVYRCTICNSQDMETTYVSIDK